MVDSDSFSLVRKAGVVVCVECVCPYQSPDVEANLYVCVVAICRAHLDGGMWFNH